MPAAMAELKRVTGELSESRDICLVSRFEWSSPRINYRAPPDLAPLCGALPAHPHGAALPSINFFSDQIEAEPMVSPQYEFCHSVWTFTLHKSLSDAPYHVVNVCRRAKPICHENRIKIQLIEIKNDEEKLISKKTETVPWRPWLHRVVFRDDGNLWQNQRGFYMKLILTLKCFECKRGIHANSTDSVGRDLLELLNSGEDSDITINVKNRVFNVHKSIIRSRSPVFFSLFKRDTIEQRNKSVDIPDCEPQAFQIFLEYVYSGEMKNCSKDTVCSLYYIADKYQVLRAKSQCVKFMSENLSLEIFCDVATLAIHHEEFELLEIVHRFFAGNFKAIIETDRWLSFLKENTVATNSFFLKLPVPEVYNEWLKEKFN